MEVHLSGLPSMHHVASHHSGPLQEGHKGEQAVGAYILTSRSKLKICAVCCASHPAPTMCSTTPPASQGLGKLAKPSAQPPCSLACLSLRCMLLQTCRMITCIIV